MGKKVAKFVGIGMLCIVAVLGIGIGIFALTGGFDQTVIVLTSLYFDEQAASSDGYVMNVQDVRTDDDAALSIKKYIVISEDYTMSIGCLPNDATNTTLEVTAYQVTPAIEFPKSVKAGVPFKITVKKDAKGNNVGGSAKLVFKSDSGVTCELFVIVDVVLNKADIKLDVSGFSSISPSYATGGSLGGNNRYVLARKSGTANLTLESVLANAFKINQSGISNKDFANNDVIKFFDKNVYIFADQEDVVTYTKNNSAPVTYDVTLNLQQVEGSNLTLYVRTHRTYEMQQEFEAMGLNVFMDFYRNGTLDPDQINNTFNADPDFSATYQELINKYNTFVNKYYDYIVEDRISSEFFENILIAGGFSLNPEMFLNQVWESLKYVFVNADIDLFISDIDIKTMQVFADSPFVLEVFENKSLTLEQLISEFEIRLENDDPTVLVKEADKLALLSNMNVGIYLLDETRKIEDVTLENELKNIYDIGVIHNGNGVNFDQDIRTVSINNLYRNNKFVTLQRTGDTFNFEALVPSKYVKDKNFQIYIVFSIAITKSTGTTSIFYDFGKIDVTYEEEVGFEGGMPYSNISYINEMCINNNNVIPEDTEAFNGAIGTQTIEVDMNRVLGANPKYLVPKFFVEKTSNEYSYDISDNGISYYEISSGSYEKKYVGKKGDNAIIYTGLDVANRPIREFVKMEGDNDEKYAYNDEILQAYELDVKHKFDETGKDADKNIYTIDVTALNALNDGSIKIFWACVLTDKDGNPIDRDGNRLFNDKNEPISIKNVEYVVIYSSLDIGAQDYLQNVGINTVALLENINYYSQNNGGDYYYVENVNGINQLRKVETGEYYLRNARDSVNDNYTKLKLISRKKYDKFLVVSGFELYTVIKGGTSTLYPSFTAQDIENATEKGIDLYGNIYKSMVRALSEENFGFSSSDNDYVVAIFDANQVALANGGTEPDIQGNPEPGVDPEPDQTQTTDTIFWGITLEAFDFDRNNAETNCSLSLNTNCSLYNSHLRDDLVVMEVNIPKISNIQTINDEDTLNNFNRQIFIDGSFVENGSAGEVAWTYSFKNQQDNAIFTFYYPGTYKVKFSISDKDSNMELLETYYESEFDRIYNKTKDETFWSDAQKEILDDSNKSLSDRIFALFEGIETYNQGGGNIENFNPLLSNNIVDMFNNTSNFIETYLNGLIHNNINNEGNESAFNFTGSLDDALNLIQNYGIFVEIANNANIKVKVEKLQEALRKFANANKGVIDNEIESLSNFEYSQDVIELTEEQLAVIQAIMTKILKNSPTYDDDFVNVRTVLKNIYKYNLKDLAEKFAIVYFKGEEFFKNCTTSGEILNNIIDSDEIVDTNGNETIEFAEILEQVNAKIIDYNLGAGANGQLTQISIEEITSDLNRYFEDGKLLFDNEIVLNPDGTIPFKTGFRDNLIIDIGLQFRFYPIQSTPGVVTYKYQVEKDYTFHMNFKSVSLEVEDFEENIDAGKTVDLKDKITLTGITNNHVTLEIPYGSQDLAYFLNEDGDKVYSVNASSTTTLHLNDLVNTNRNIEINVSIPYQDSNGNLLAGVIHATVNYNYVVNFADIKFVSSPKETNLENIVSGDTGYYDLTTFVESGLTVLIDDLELDKRVSLKNNILKISAHNISNEKINLNIKLKNSSTQDIVAEFKKEITILPYYKVVLGFTENNGSTYIQEKLLTNHFNIYDLELIKVYEIIQDNLNDENPNNDYRLLDKNIQSNFELIKEIVSYEGIYVGENSVTEIIGLPNIKEVQEQYYSYNETDKVYEPTYIASKLTKTWLNNVGDIDISEFAETVILPIKVNYLGYSGSIANINICLRIGGITKYENISGDGKIEEGIATFDKAVFEENTNSYKQNFTTIELAAGGEYDLHNYIQLVLNYADEYPNLTVSYSIKNTVDANEIKFDKNNNGANLTVGGGTEQINAVLTIGENVADGTIITLNLTAYKIISADANGIIAETIPYTDTVTIKVLNPASADPDINE